MSTGGDTGALKASLEQAAGLPDSNSLWPHLSREFALDHHLNQRAVQDAVRKYTKNPEWLIEAQERISLYLPYFLEEIRRRKLPAELALLPIVESTLNPAALSPRGALGLWQFMPETANRFGLSRDWWHDSRQDTVASTRAALDYLELLHAQFGDWLLTMAAYNAGEGTVARTLPRARLATDKGAAGGNFFEMRGLPSETRNYVPRVLALAAILKDPEKYDIELPPVARAVRFEAITTDKPVDLQQVASILDVPPAELVALNPAFHRQATPPNGKHNLLVPARIADHAQARVDAMTASGALAPMVEYRVRRGDSLSRIARTFNSSVAAIRQLNGLSSDRISANALLQIPRTGGHAGAPGIDWATTNTTLAAAPAKRPTTYRVRQGDSLGVIARRFNVPLNALIAENNLRGTTIRANAALRIPSAGADATQQRTATTLPPVVAAVAKPPRNRSSEVNPKGEFRATRAYQVLAGDSLSTIAARHGVTISQLKRLNGLHSDALRANQTLRVPAPTGDALLASVPAQTEVYRIRPGDTLWSIARRLSVSHEELMRVNRLGHSSVLRVGSTLTVPQPAPADIAGG